MESPERKEEEKKGAGAGAGIKRGTPLQTFITLTVIREF